MKKQTILTGDVPGILPDTSFGLLRAFWESIEIVVVKSVRDRAQVLASGGGVLFDFEIRSLSICNYIKTVTVDNDPPDYIINWRWLKFRPTQTINAPIRIWPIPIDTSNLILRHFISTSLKLERIDAAAESM